MKAPDENVQAFEALYCIEVGLRELIVVEMQSVFGNRWYKQGLPGGEIAKKFKDARDYERVTPWSRCVPHHPVYYLDFPHLAAVIEKGDNWERVFKNVFARKDIIVATLRGLEPIRNKIAHNRRATAGDVAEVTAVHSKLVSMVGESRWGEFVARNRDAMDLQRSLTVLRAEASSANSAMRGCAPVAGVPVWLTSSEQWWFDSDYLSADVTPVERFFGIVSEYMAQPRVRGCGFALERWLRENEAESAFDACDRVFATLEKV